jgi:ApaG protein
MSENLPRLDDDDLPTAVTEGIRVTVRTRFLPERSKPMANQYLFAYEIAIENEGEEPAQLLTRHWIITDANGQVEEVRGDGVVGEQPELDPGQGFSYTSFCPLATETGVMTGSYGMVRPDGRKFDVVVPDLELGRPYVVN